MARRTTREIEKNEVEEIEPSTDIEPAQESKEGGAIDIVNGELYIRQYSRAVHGDNFKDLADEFCSKKPKRGSYTAVPASSILEVEVRFREKEDADKPLDAQKPDAKMVDKEVRFKDKAAALRLGAAKTMASVVIRKKK